MLTIVLSSLLLFSPPPASSALQCDQQERAVLLKIKSSFANPGSLCSLWDTSTDCCTWSGIECTESGLINSLTISNSNLSGMIPHSIGDLAQLFKLRLHNLPGLSGPIPSSLNNLSFLSFITISRTSVSGHIPAFLGLRYSYSYIDLSHNKLSGPIPDPIGGSEFFYLDLSHNRLTGRIPNSLFRGSIANPTLDLSHNMLSGKVPQLGHLDFSSINLSSNRLTGDASFLFGESKGTEKIDLSWNEIDTNMTNLSLPKGLMALELRHNRIRGMIPEAITGLEKLQRFNVSYNKLCGEIPRGGPMKQFDASCYADNMCLCGPPLRYDCPR